MPTLLEFMGGCIAPQGAGAMTTDFQAFAKGGRCINIVSLDASTHAVVMPHTTNLKSGGPYFYILNDDATDTVDLEYPASANMLTNPEDFTHADWEKLGDDVPVVTGNTHVAPDGTTTADRVDFGTAGNSSRLKQDVTIDETKPHVPSLFVQNLESYPVNINLTYGNGSDIHVIPVDSAWHLLIGTAPVGTNDQFRIQKKSEDAAFSVAVWGAQLLEATWYEDYIPQSYTTAFHTLSADRLVEVYLANAAFDGLAKRWLVSSEHTFSVGGTISVAP